MVPPKAAQRSGTKQEVSSSVSISKRSTKHAAADAETGIKRIRHEEDDNTPSRSGKLSRHQETSKFTLRGSTQHGADMISDEDDNRTVFRTASAPAPARVAPPGLISPAQGGQPRTAHVQPPTWMSDMSDTGLAELSAQIQSVIARRQTLTALPATHPVLTAPVQHFPHGLMDPYTSQLQYIKDMGPFPSIPIHPRQHQYNAQQYGQQYPPSAFCHVQPGAGPARSALTAPTMASASSTLQLRAAPASAVLIATEVKTTTVTCRSTSLKLLMVRAAPASAVPTTTTMTWWSVITM